MGITGAALLLAAALAAGEAPKVGQPGKDVGWVPTPERMVRRLLQLADVSASDVVLDLGAGDGRFPIYAAKHFGARGIGVELEANLVEAARQSAAAQGVAQRVQFIQRDLFDADLSAASVISLYTAPAVMERLKPRLLRLKPGTRVVSHHFALGDWFADEEVQVDGRKGYLWVVPATVAGDWNMAAGEDFHLRIRQRHQLLEMSAERAGQPVPVAQPRLRGTEIHFALHAADGSIRFFEGQVDGERMSGAGWSATRQKR